ncbi:uncharacterized protein [Euwallacea fornicatus]|uniref:uncharacterized protein isoform X1 n=1 Tax=Euwallacea fornicatus TaxID=995702 RepID=UPI003390130D
MRYRHRWPYIFALMLHLTVCLATPNARLHPLQRQLHRLVGGHLRILDPDPSDDSELITASAGENTKKQNTGKGGDDRKTLSQQVADGKYGLIQKELFKKPPKKPGIISYAPNHEVPSDNIATLGGLTKNDIWLAENHLLVIKGGGYPAHDDSKQDYVGQLWQPLDDYNAPLHQVKIPKNPAVPPPFPVQLTDDGPLQILGTNSSRTLNASAETPAYALPPPPGWDGEIPPQSQYFPDAGSPNSDPANPSAGEVAVSVPVSGEPPGGMPFPPTFLNGSLPPSFAHLPPGVAILPAPLENATNTDILDEDDPSIYYPPPYSFFYPKDNSSLVPPGPLVPGIILPPPPKFFAPLEEDSATTTRKPIHTTKHVTTTQAATTTERPLGNEIGSTKRPTKIVPTKVSVVKNYSKVTVRVHTSRRPQQKPLLETTKLLRTTIPTTGRPKMITILPVHVNKLNRTYLPVGKNRRPPVTVLKPVKNELLPPKEQPYNNEIRPRPVNLDQINRHRPDFGANRPQRPQYREKQYNGAVTTQVPLKYHKTNVEVSSVSPGQEKFPIGLRTQHPKSTPPPQANFYYYEETDPALNTITTEDPRPKQNQDYYNDWSPIFVDVKPSPPPPPPLIRTPVNKPQYIYVTGRPYESEKPRFRYVPQRPKNTFSIHIANLQSQLQQHYSTHRPTPKPVYQYSFEAQNYRRPEGGKAFRPSPLMDGSDDSFKPIPQYSVQIQPAIEIVPTQRPNYQQVQQLSVDEPSYFSSERPPQQYFQEEQKKKPAYISDPLRYLPQRNTEVVVTPSKPIAEFSYEVTPNPVNQGYYTKPDEGYFDENTKQYFSVFGRKLPSSTTPLPPVERPPLRQRYKDRPLSLESDIKVNYAEVRPAVEGQSEPIKNDNRAEIVKAIEITPPPFNPRGRERYIHYPLPGDQGAHFYFLTPQAERRRQAGQFFFEREGRMRREESKMEKEERNDKTS